jgi:hypothetical protein
MLVKQTPIHPEMRDGRLFDHIRPPELRLALFLALQALQKEVLDRQELEWERILMEKRKANFEEGGVQSLVLGDAGCSHDEPVLLCVLHDCARRAGLSAAWNPALSLQVHGTLPGYLLHDAQGKPANLPKQKPIHLSWNETCSNP